MELANRLVALDAKEPCRQDTVRKVTIGGSVNADVVRGQSLPAPVLSPAEGPAGLLLPEHLERPPHKPLPESDRRLAPNLEQTLQPGATHRRPKLPVHERRACVRAPRVREGVDRRKTGLTAK